MQIDNPRFLIIYEGTKITTDTHDQAKEGPALPSHTWVIIAKLEGAAIVSTQQDVEDISSAVGQTAILATRMLHILYCLCDDFSEKVLIFHGECDFVVCHPPSLYFRDAKQTVVALHDKVGLIIVSGGDCSKVPKLHVETLCWEYVA